MQKIAVNSAALTRDRPEILPGASYGETVAVKRP